ncbi:unnamed protein product [Brassica rapa subsp. narinosa]
MEKIKPQLHNLEQKFISTSQTVEGIEAKVVLQAKDMFVKFKEEVIICVKEMFDALCKEHFVSPSVPSNVPTAAPTQEPGPAMDSAGVYDANAITIGNVLRNISEYSTPPRSPRMSQDENLTPSKIDHVVTGFVSPTPGAETCALSANSENRTRQNASDHPLDENLTPSKIDHVVTGFVSPTPGAETCAVSANSENRTRQNASHHPLDGRKRQRDNIGSEPSFSLGLTQDEQFEAEEPIKVTEDRHRERTSETNVHDNFEQGQGSRKSKRQKTVPSGLVEDYQCGRHIMSRVREAQKYIFVFDDQSEVTRKHVELCVKLGEKFVINMGGLAVDAKDLKLLLERPRLFSAKVMDILIRVARIAVCPNLPPEGPRSSQFLDTKFVVAINRTFPKFLKSRNKDAYKFPKGLMDIFPSKDGPPVHSLRYYFPFNVGMKHWVGICFDAGSGVLTVLDCNTSLYKDSAVEKYLNPIVQVLPYLARYVGHSIGEEPVFHCYDVARPKYVAQNKNHSDSGLMALLLMATHALYGIEACKHISADILEEEGMRAAILAYEFKEAL